MNCDISVCTYVTTCTCLTMCFPRSYLLYSDPCTLCTIARTSQLWSWMQSPSLTMPDTAMARWALFGHRRFPWLRLWTILEPVPLRRLLANAAQLSAQDWAYVLSADRQNERPSYRRTNEAAIFRGYCIFWKSISYFSFYLYTKSMFVLIFFGGVFWKASSDVKFICIQNQFLNFHLSSGYFETSISYCSFYLDTINICFLFQVLLRGSILEIVYLIFRFIWIPTKSISYFSFSSGEKGTILIMF